jgi:hypothetical protein
MALDDLVAKFESFTNPSDSETPDIDTVLAGVTEVYNQDMSVRDQAVRDREERLAERDKEISTLKLANYGLMMKLPGSTVTNDKTTDNDDDDEAERAATIKVADLFTKRK